MIEEFSVSPEVVKISASAIMGGIVFKIIERFLNGKTFVNEHTTLRLELRAELDHVRGEVHELKREVDTWRERYYEQLTISQALESSISELRTELHSYRRDLLDSDEMEIITDLS